MLVAGFAYGSGVFYLAFQNRVWQLFVLAGVAVALGLVIILSSWLMLTRRAGLGVRLAVFALLVGILVSVGLVAGLSVSGLVAALATVGVVLMLAGPVLSAQDTRWLVGGSAVVGFVVPLLDLVLDLYVAPYRLPAPQVLTLLSTAIAGVLVIVAVVLAARQFVNYSLRTKLMLAFVAVALISAAVLAYLSDRATRSALISGANQALFATAAQTAAGLDDFIQANLNDIRTEARLPVLARYLGLSARERPGSLEEAELAVVLQALGGKDVVHVASYAVLDMQGRNLMDTDVGNIGGSEAGQDYFLVPIERGLPYVSPVLFSPRTGRADLYFSAPVRDVGGRVVGVLRMRYNARVLQSLVFESTGRAGEGSFGVLFDEHHIHLAHGTAPDLILKSVAPLDPERVAELQAAGRLPAGAVADLLVDLPDLERGLANADTQPYFTTELTTAGSGVHSAAAVSLATQPWLVVFFQPQEVFLAPLQTQSRITVALAVLIAGVTAGAGVGIAQSLTGPVVQLTAVARRVAAGDLSAQAPAESTDEIGTLASTFNMMTLELRQTLEGLEQRVAERTQALERRTSYLEASAEVSRAVISVLETELLTQQVVELIRERFGLYYVGLFMLDESGEWAVLRAGTGEAGQAMLARSHRLRVGGGSMIGWSIANAQARVALEAGEDAVRLATPELPETRSEAALPLRSRGRVLGALTVQDDQPGAFDEAAIVVLQTMADQVAVAFDNARLFDEAQQALQATRRAYGELSQEAWRQLLDAQPDLGYRSDEHGIAAAGRVWRPEVEEALRTGRTVRGDGADAGTRIPLAVPIKLRDDVIGVLETYKAADSGAWSAEEVAVLETLAEQLGVALEGARLYQDTQRRAAREQLTREITDRMRRAANVEAIVQTAVDDLSRVLGTPRTFVRLGVSAPPPAEPQRESARDDGEKVP